MATDYMSIFIENSSSFLSFFLVGYLDRYKNVVLGTRVADPGIKAAAAAAAAAGGAAKAGRAVGKLTRPNQTTGVTSTPARKGSVGAYAST